MYGFQRLLYPEIYKSIDAMFYGNGAGMKMYFICDVGSRPSDIQMKFTGATSVSIVSQKLQIVSSIGSMSFEQPTAFQIDGGGNIITLNWQPTYSSLGSNKFGFTLGSYDASKPLIIVMKKGNPPSPSQFGTDWSTWVGGTLQDVANAVVTDGSGSSYLGGGEFSNPFPNITGEIQNQQLGDQDCFIEKFDHDGVPVWGDYYGGTGGEEIQGIALNSIGDIYFVGETSSGDFPNAANALNGIQDGFIVRIDISATNLLWARYLGGNSDDMCRSVAVDNSDNIYVAGQSHSSTGFPFQTYGSAFYKTGIITPFSEAFIAKFNSSNTQLWGTYFGGDDNDDFCEVKIHPLNQHVFICGSTASATPATSYSGNPLCGVPVNNTYFPDCNPGGGAYHQSTFGGGVSGNHDAIIVEFDASGVLQWSTYFGGNGNETSAPPIKNSLALDLLDPNILYITGWEAGSNFGFTFPFVSPNGAYNQTNITSGAYIAKFVSRVQQWGTLFGCTNTTSGWSVTTDNKHNAYVCGLSWCSSPAPSSDYCMVPSSTSKFPICIGGNGEFFQQGGVPTFGGGQYDGFIAGFNGNNALIWSTYYGGNSSEQLNAITFDPVYSRIYTAGKSQATSGYPYYLDPGTANTYLQSPNGGLNDATIARLGVLFINVGISSNEIPSSLNLFPNPTNDLIYLDGSAIQNKIQKIEVLDMFGRNILTVSKEQIESENKITFDLRAFASGVYIINVTTEKATYSGKVIKQ